MAKLKLKFSNFFTFVSSLVIGLGSTQAIAQEEPKAAGDESSNEAEGATDTDNQSE